MIKQVQFDVTTINPVVFEPTKIKLWFDLDKKFLDPQTNTWMVTVFSELTETGNRRKVVEYEENDIPVDSLKSAFSGLSDDLEPAVNDAVAAQILVSYNLQKQ